MAKREGDRLWLKSIKPKDRLGVLEGRAKDILELIQSLEKRNCLPHTIGLFGSWGSGKTSTVAYIADELESAGYPLIYFNAYKYASYMEVVPALMYQLLSNTPVGRDASAKTRLLSIITTLSGKYANRFGSAIEAKIGVNPVELGKDLLTVKDVLDAPQAEMQKILEAYYTRVDKAQDELEELFKAANLNKPTVVLIDELDRCDPGEAFEAMKQLRILFNMRGIPIVFILVANPHPIGLAIRHQFGLDSEQDEYEAGRILEKFVDTYIDLSEPCSMGEYVRELWERNQLGKIGDVSLVIGLDERTRLADGLELDESPEQYGKAIERMSSSNTLYSNLRTLEKTLAFATSRHRDAENFWTLWHLLILKQSDPQLRNDISKVTHDLKWIVESATERLIGVLKRAGQIQENGTINASISFEENGVHTPYGVYHQGFWDGMHRRVAQLDNSSDEQKILCKLRSSVPTMDFLIKLCMPSIPDSAKIEGGNAGQWYSDSFRTFGWLLSEF